MAKLIFEQITYINLSFSKSWYKKAMKIKVKNLL